MNHLEPYNFFFELPLYTKIPIDKENAKDFMNLMTLKESFDGYNPELKQDTTFQISKNPSHRYGPQNRAHIETFSGINDFEIRCVRNGFKIHVFINVDIEKDFNDDDDYKIKSMSLCKIGQLPSIADLQISKIKQYDKILGKAKLKEITRAVGLAANGVGIGSFVYLRRVFEDLIEEAHSKAKLEAGWDENQYINNRTIEKIEQLKDHLPTFLVERKKLYSILSKGIHELEENECLTYFDAVKLGIEMILDEKVEEYQKIKKREEVALRIQAISQQIGNK